MPRVRLVIFAAVWLIWLASCSSQDVAPRRAPPVVAASELQLDLSGLIQRVRLAFRDDGDGFVAHPGSYESWSRGGTLRVAPGGWADGPATLALSLERVGRAGWSAAFGETVRGSDGALSLSAGVATERRRNTPEGVLQEWSFSEEPPGTGPIEVRLRVMGPPLAAETESGLHFLDPRSGVGIAYGHATWVDASGVRSPVRARFAVGEIVLTVPEQVIAHSRFPAVLDPLISPEMGVDNPVPTSADARGTAVAHAAAGHLVAWAETSGRIYAARIDAAGTLLDPFGIEVANTNDPFGVTVGLRPTVASNGTDFLVAYTPATSPTQRDLVARRVRASDGAVLDAADIPISTTTAWENFPELIFTGSSYYIVWSQGSPAAILGARLDAVTGQRLDGSAAGGGTPLMAGIGSAGFALASNGSSVLVTAAGKGVRADLSNGALLDTTPFTITGLKAWGPISWPMDGVSAIFDGTNYFVSWANSTGIVSARVTPAGVVLDAPDEFNQLPGGLVGCTTSSSFPASLPKLVVSGSSRILLSQRSKALYASRIDTTTGALLDKSASDCGKLVAGMDGGYDATLSPGLLFAVAGARGLRIDPSTLGLQQSLVVAKEANDETEPSVASNGTDFLVAWVDSRNTSPGNPENDIYAVRIKGLDGSVLDSTAIPLSTAFGKQSAPAVASDGKDYFVVWESGAGGAIRGTRVRASDGAVLDGSAATDAKQIHEGTWTALRGQPAVASDGVGYLVTYLEGNVSFNHVYAMRYAADGSVLTGVSGKLMSLASASAYEVAAPAAVADRQSSPSQRTYLVVWRDRASSTSTEKLRFARIRSELGSNVDLYGKDLASVGPESRAQLASDGSSFLVAWDRYASGFPQQKNIFGTRIDPANGSLLDSSPFGIVTSALDDAGPSLAHDGKHYHVVWSAQALGVSAVVGMRVDGDGKLLDGPSGNGGFMISDASTQRVRAAANAAGRVLVVFPRNVMAQGTPASRVRARFVEDSPAEADGGISWDGPWLVPDAASDGSDASMDAATDGSNADGAPDAASGGSSGAAGAGGGASGGAAGGSAGAGTGGSGAISAGGGAGGGSAGQVTGGASGSSSSGADDGGCGCRASSSRTESGIPFLLIALALRRRRARSR